MHTTTLRSLGNFKAAIVGDVHKIHGISKPRAFQLLKDGDQMSYTQSAIDLWGLINQFMFDNDKKNK